MRLVFLGTSSAAPSRERNVASVAIVVDGRVFLFDCGEGTQHQLLRAPVRSGAIEAIFLSHLHGDHVYGLPGLMATMSLNNRQAPLAIHGPRGTEDYVKSTLHTSHHHPIFPVDVREEEEHASDGLRVVFAELEHSVKSLGWCVIEDDKPGKFDVEKARALGVPEGPAFGILQKGGEVDGVRAGDVLGPRRKGRKVVYCTDTRPCRAAVELARDADVLIHEATYGDELAAEAHARFHATAREAAGIAKAANVKQLYLTHFSTRYEDVTPLVEQAREVFPNTEAAGDLMEVEVDVAPRPVRGERVAQSAG